MSTRLFIDLNQREEGDYLAGIENIAEVLSYGSSLQVITENVTDAVLRFIGSERERNGEVLPFELTVSPAHKAYSNRKVVISVDLPHKTVSEEETDYLLSNPETRRRLLAAKERDGGMSLEEVRAQLGI